MLELFISFTSLYWISYSLRICSQISTKSSNVVFSIKIPENLQKNVCEEWEITEINYWLRLLIFDVESWFLFSQPVPKQHLSLL